MWTSPQARARRGGALLAVLWLTAALAAIAFSVATTVRAETERSATALDSLRAYYVAVGALERAILYMDWGPGPVSPDGVPRYWVPWRSRLYFQFPAGDAVVEIIPESSKLNLNTATPEDLYALLVQLGAEPERAREIALAIVDWRTPAAEPTPFDQYYLSLNPSFRARHASFEEVEEALLVKGMTAELFYGYFAVDAQGRLFPRGGFRDCVTVYGGPGRLDVNTTHPALLAAAGLSPGAVNWILERRRTAPFRDMRELEPVASEPGFHRLGIGGGTIYTLRATARLRLPDGSLSELRRSVAATIKRLPPGWDRTYHVLRWYENAWGHLPETRMGPALAPM
ncbi:MAG: type II secretion system protein GspK [Bryobacterales bacterium]|nr:general secretion pathway protein GspK [Bryobacteraceae bacterium]MDW8131190.1 type II secretion system protein GspK [Bryobacterales bacterium]